MLLNKSKIQGNQKGLPESKTSIIVKMYIVLGLVCSNRPNLCCILYKVLEAKLNDVDVRAFYCTLEAEITTELVLVELYTDLPSHIRYTILKKG